MSSCRAVHCVSKCELFVDLVHVCLCVPLHPRIQCAALAVVIGL